MPQSTIPIPQLATEVISYLRRSDALAISEIPPQFGQLSSRAQQDNSKLETESQSAQPNAELENFQRLAHQVSSLLAPIRRVPSEILQHIFILTTSSSPEEGGNIFGVYRTWQSPSLIISAVCFRWRCIALSTPEIWTHLAVDVFHPKARIPVELFLSRSKNQNLWVTMSEHSIDLWNSDRQLLGLLTSESHRWYSMDYHYREPNYETELRHLEDRIVGKLSSIRHIRCIPETFVQENSILRGHPLDLLTLTVRFTSRIMEPYPDITPFPFRTNVQNLIIQFGSQRGSFEKSLQVLRVCAETIRSLSYQAVPSSDRLNRMDSIETYMAEESPPIPEPIHCPNTTEMMMVLSSRIGAFAANIMDLLDSVNTPLMRRVSLTGRSLEDGIPQQKSDWGPSFKNFLDRSCCVLADIVLDGLPLSGLEVLSIIRLTPCLEQLKIVERWAQEDRSTLPETITNICQTVDKGLLSELVIRQPGSDDQLSYPVLVPNLRSLQLRVLSHFDAGQEFVDIVRSRWYPPAAVPLNTHHSSLRTATLVIFGDLANESVYSPLKLYDKEGLQVVVKADERIVV